jgi:hypothetical protein
MTAWWRYRVSIGRDDGLALARQQLTPDYGAARADYALSPLTAAATGCPELDNIIAGDTPEPLPPEPEPTATQRRAGARALAGSLHRTPRMGSLERRLEAPLTACEAEGGVDMARPP